jgi:thiamine monophosphate synthase
VRLPSPLYVILDREAARGRALPELLDAVLAGGGRLVQLRDKTRSMAELLPLTRALRARCRAAGALFIVNDRLGVSTHDPAQARQALADGADYVAVGSMFPTPTKAGFQLVGPDLVRRVRQEIPVPLVAIGGITEANAAEVMSAGADAVAVISAVCGAPDPREATARFLRAIAACRPPGNGR